MDPVSINALTLKFYQATRSLCKLLSHSGKSLLLKISSAMSPYNNEEFSTDIDFS